MLKKIFYVLLISCFFTLGLSSCGKDDNLSEMEKIQKNLNEMESYQANTEFTVISNKGESEYKAVQMATKDGKYKIEMTAPDAAKGNYTIYDGNSVCQYNAKLDKTVKVEMPDLKGRNEIILFSFIENYLKSEGVAIETANMEEKSYTVLEAVIPGSNPVLSTEKLFVSNENFLPEKLIIYDQNGKERYIILYKDFEYNKQFDESIFDTSNCW